jgi:hypothetical protein
VLVVLCWLQAPTIEIEDVYPLSSHSTHMTFKYTVVDDTELSTVQYAVGTGPGRKNVVPWTSIADIEFKPNGTVSKPLDFFAAPIDGKVAYFQPNPTVHTTEAPATTDRRVRRQEDAATTATPDVPTTPTVSDTNKAIAAGEHPDRFAGPLQVLADVDLETCAKECVEIVEGLGCHSFDYSATYRHCHLHRVTTAHEDSARVLAVHDYQFYIREATNNVHIERGEVQLTDLELKHAGVYFFTIRVSLTLVWLSKHARTYPCSAHIPAAHIPAARIPCSVF